MDYNQNFDANQISEGQNYVLNFKDQLDEEQKQISTVTKFKKEQFRVQIRKQHNQQYLSNSRTKQLQRNINLNNNEIQTNEYLQQQIQKVLSDIQNQFNEIQQNNYEQEGLQNQICLNLNILYDQLHESLPQNLWQQLFSIIEFNLQNLNSDLQIKLITTLNNIFFGSKDSIQIVHQNNPNIITILTNLMFTSLDISIRESACFCLYNYLYETKYYQIFQNFQSQNLFFEDLLIQSCEIQVEENNQQKLQEFLTILIDFVENYIETSRLDNQYNFFSQILDFFDHVFKNQYDNLSIQAREASLNSILMIVELAEDNSDELTDFLDIFFTIILKFMYTENYFKGFDQQQRNMGLLRLGKILCIISGADENQAKNLMKSGIFEIVEQLMENHKLNQEAQQKEQENENLFVLQALKILQQLTYSAQELASEYIINYNSQDQSQNEHFFIKKLWEYTYNKISQHSLILQESLLLLSNILTVGHRKECEMLCQFGIIDLLTQAIASPLINSDSSFHILTCFQSILYYGKHMQEDEQLSENPYVAEIEKFNGHFIIQDLQTDKDDRVYKLATKLLEVYWITEDTQNNK